MSTSHVPRSATGNMLTPSSSNLDTQESRDGPLDTFITYLTPLFQNKPPHRGIKSLLSPDGKARKGLVDVSENGVLVLISVKASHRRGGAHDGGHESSVTTQ